MELSRADCLALVATAAVGRIVFTRGALPFAQPVPFLLDHEEIVFRASDDTVLAAAAHGQVVAFEADEIVDGTGTGWSVCGVGTAHLALDPSRLDELPLLGPPSWPRRSADTVVVLPLQYLVGRRYVLTGT